MKIFIASLICVAVGSLVLPHAIDHTELFTFREAGTLDVQCPRNCQGDFPASSNRKYAASGTPFEHLSVVRG